MVPVDLSKIIINEQSDEQVIFLKEKGGPRTFPIIIGIFEAAAIDRIIKERESPRPLTHDLISSIIKGLGGKLVRSVVDDLKNDTYYAKIVIQQGKEDIYVDARPSDAITIALQANAPIFVAEKVMNLVARPEGPQAPEEKG